MNCMSCMFLLFIWVTYVYTCMQYVLTIFQQQFNEQIVSNSYIWSYSETPYTKTPLITRRIWDGQLFEADSYVTIAWLFVLDKISALSILPSIRFLLVRLDSDKPALTKDLSYSMPMLYLFPIGHVSYHSIGKLGSRLSWEVGLNNKTRWMIDLLQKRNLLCWKQLFMTWFEHQILIAMST